MYRIIISQKAYSSWSLRGWLLLEAFGLDYLEHSVPLYDPAFDEIRSARAPARTVPILEWDEDGRTHRVWDSLAIAETLAERHPDAGIWPSDAGARAIARMLVAEMHSGFHAIRSACPMNLHRNGRPLNATPAEVTADVERAETLWSWALESTGGPWLGGTRFSAADVFFAPLAFRLRSYGLMTAGTRDYVDRLLAHPAVVKWTGSALADPSRLDIYDSIV